VKVENLGYSISEEQEILVFMHTVFRIDEMHRIKDLLWEVNLTLTNDTNSQWKCLTDYIRNQVSVVDGWYRLAFLMLQMGKIHDALEIFDTLQQTACDDDRDMAHIAQSCVVTINAQLHCSTEIRSNAFVQLKKPLDYWEDTLPVDHPMFGMGYMSMSHVYRSSGDYVAALTYSEKALEIFQQSSSSDESVLAIIHNSVGELHRLKGNYPLALSHFKKALEIH
jgi:tetratricopeptide (TPR) repeat protein